MVAGVVVVVAGQPVVMVLVTVGMTHSDVQPTHGFVTVVVGVTGQQSVLFNHSAPTE